MPEDKNSTDSNSLTETTVEEYVVRRRKKKRGVRQANLDALPQVDKVHELKGKKRFCNTCGEKLEIIGKHLAHREIKCKPMEFYCENSYVQTGKCQHCVNPMNGNDKLIQAMAPAPFAVHSYFSASVVAEILYSKYVLALPLNRQAQNWRALIPLSSKAMAEQVIKNAARFKPLYELLRKALSEETVIYLDETPLRVVKSERSKCYFWAASSAKEFNQHNIACFFYAASRGGEIIPQIIGPDYRGCLMCDGHSAYQQERLPNGTLGACLIHIARKFKEIVKIGKGAKILQHSKAAEAATKLGEIFHTEHDLSYTTGEEKAAQRRLRLKPLLDEFYRFIGEIKHPIGKLRVAINYALNQKERVYQIFEHGELPLDNNHDEQLIWPTTIGRKNYLFAKTEAGAEANAIWYTFIQTAKLNQLKVREYLEHLLSAFTWTESPVWEAYLLWDPEIQRKFGTQ